MASISIRSRQPRSGLSEKCRTDRQMLKLTPISRASALHVHLHCIGQVLAQGFATPKQVVFNPIASTIADYTLFGMIVKLTATTSVCMRDVRPETTLTCTHSPTMQYQGDALPFPSHSITSYRRVHAICLVTSRRSWLTSTALLFTPRQHRRTVPYTLFRGAALDAVK